MIDRQWTRWQLIDSAFPSGGFAHSSGFESAWKQGLATDRRSVEGWLLGLARQTALGTLPFVKASCHRPDDFQQIDARCDAQLLNHVARRASRAQGRAFVAAAEAAFADAPDHPLFTGLLRTGPRHMGPVFGYVARTLELSPEEAGEVFTFTALRSALSAAVRLGAVGPLEAQAILHRLGPAARDLAQRAPDDETRAATACPLMEAAQANHDRIYSRLFQS